ncbi:MAG: hypothetical protein NC123_13030 [Butyrivibrio sp.]|nr:hypothetical protein [Acetatifactor muris]MCM1558081.1 hypothetical protein [Butyrivibrio sp.]MCM1560444.1 hypothetical protein [Butyrivibrio sp.]
MADKVSGVLRTAGFALCLLCTVYMLYLIGSRQVVSALEESGAKTFTIAGMVAVTEGRVVRTESGYTVIRYYHEWDGTEYQGVKNHVSGGCPENAKLPVIYGVGAGAGSCLAVGLYEKPMQVLGAAGAVSLLLGLLMNLKKKGIEENGKKKDYSRQLEDEHDAR